MKNKRNACFFLSLAAILVGCGQSVPAASQNQKASGETPPSALESFLASQSSHKPAARGYSDDPASPFRGVVCHYANKLAVEGTLKDLDMFESWIETVPQEEAKYLDQENSAAFNAGSEARMRMVIARPFYHAWDVHQEIEKTRTAIKALQALPATATPKQRLKLAARVPADLSLLKSSFEQYMEYDKRREPHLLDAEKTVKAINILAAEPVNFEQYLWCSADLLPD